MNVPAKVSDMPRPHALVPAIIQIKTAYHLEANLCCNKGSYQLEGE
jgi:hypothetical protein